MFKVMYTKILKAGSKIEFHIFRMCNNPQIIQKVFINIWPERCLNGVIVWQNLKETQENVI